MNVPDDDKPLTPAEARQKFEQVCDEFLAGESPGTISFRLKRPHRAGQLYPLKLTELQRRSLLEFTEVSRNLKKKIEQAGEGTKIIKLTWKELNKLNELIRRGAKHIPGADENRLGAVMDKIGKFFDEAFAEVLRPEAKLPRRRLPIKSDRLFQFKITLLDIKPAIWRRIQIPDCTLPDLHEYIQAAFGWWNYHLHLFEIAGTTYMEPDPDGDDWGMEFEDERRMLISKLLPKSGKRTRWIYEYDLGDSWQHEVLFEGFPPTDPKAKFPLCLEGARACPPEDCGGWPGYVNYLDAISDPKHEEHREMVRWRGPFDPEAFDVKKATREMRKVKS